MSTLLLAGLVLAIFAAFTVLRAVRIVPQARARNVERLGRYQRTLTPGLNFVIPNIVTTALRDVSKAFSDVLPRSAAATVDDSDRTAVAQAEKDIAQASEAAAEAVADAAEAAEPVTAARSGGA
ncbi:hypothetical protein C8D88_10744 [Lentzea atacamensis]|uniref:SPFH domain / Band 7 family protein n=1 Tax=Lentzea atacamensis TaxID=531938 RepID=A0A316HUF4_9PSEU|nr:hypothetical protein [Lentzea atacamensis]PWK84837.1 hypothetical protein C8D88_10744 [Lentzea atacamensis]